MLFEIHPLNVWDQGFPVVTPGKPLQSPLRVNSILYAAFCFSPRRGEWMPTKEADEGGVFL